MSACEMGAAGESAESYRRWRRRGSDAEENRTRTFDAVAKTVVFGSERTADELALMGIDASGPARHYEI